MIESIPFSLGLAVGAVVGSVIAWLAVSAKLRSVFHGQLTSISERAQRAETLSEELRRQRETEQTEHGRLRQEFQDMSRSCAIAETRAAEAFRHAEEQKTLLSQARQELADSFRALSGEALKHNNEAFLSLAKATYETLQTEAKGDLAQRQQAIDELVRPLTESLHRYDEQLRAMEQSRQAAYGGLDQHMKLLAESQQRLKEETGNLVNALRAPAVRGRWGEITLKRVVELAGMVAHCDFTEQESVAVEDGRLRPDMIVQLPGGRQIVVDAKAALNGYLDAYEASGEDQRREGLRRHAAQVRTHMGQLSLKAYWSQFAQAPEFVVLFLPGEQFLGAALEQDPGLIEDGFAQGVVLATPTTLMALLRAVAYGWRQERLTAHAEEAGRLGKDLYERMAVLAEHLNDVGQALGRSVTAYNKAVGSLETRILPAARRFKELGVASDKDIPLLGPMEIVPRRTLPHDE
ncbi:putative DNA recombination protein RmuC [Nitrospira japonica]|uniref:Putative DNA recombination protein RmuC n=1 Tax=Nitrospira japonica TaxID=1325564 RepID=A0A1W1I4G9_9BACT|nr:DNA recombination protein RmuC [Nitrospira japonica]SLM47713.1 putative DNA recombination protein RmuC [Nitrospira japonica]